jgi:hypothetical protein
LFLDLLLFLKGRIDQLLIASVIYITVGVLTTLYIWMLSKSRYLEIFDEGITQAIRNKPARKYNWDQIIRVIKITGPIMPGIHLTFSDKGRFFIPKPSQNIDLFEKEIVHRNISINRSFIYLPRRK